MYRGGCIDHSMKLCNGMAGLTGAGTAKLHRSGSGADAYR